MNKIVFPKNYVVWDLETSGLTPGIDHVLEIGIITVRDGEIVPEAGFEAILNHKIDIPERITEITGLTKEKIDQEGGDPLETLLKVLDIFEGETAFVTHNGTRFDIEFLIREMRRILPAEMSPRIDSIRDKLLNFSVDTAALYKAKKLGEEIKEGESVFDFFDRVLEIYAPGIKYKVGICCDELGIDKSAVTQHRAGGDIILTNEIYKKFAREDESSKMLTGEINDEPF